MPKRGVHQTILYGVEDDMLSSAYQEKIPNLSPVRGQTQSFRPNLPVQVALSDQFLQQKQKGCKAG